MKRIMAAFAAAVILLVGAAALVGCGGTEPEEKGVLLSLGGAYESGWLTQEEVLSIAYYHNGGRKGNEEIMTENYAPMPKTPAELDAETEMGIKRTAAQEYNKAGFVTHAVPDGFYISAYYGTYDDCVAMVVMSSYLQYEDAIRTETVANVKFFYTYGYEIIVWKAEK